jgi:uncharacterized protein YegL
MPKKLQLDTPTITELAVHIVLDRSGSMNSIKPDVIGGFNQFIETLKTETPGALVSLTLFDSGSVDTIINNQPVESVEPLNDASYQPRGGTPLYDAITHCVSLLDGTTAQNKTVVIITDGEENSSRTATKTSVKTLLEDKQENARWQVQFIAANIDAFAEGGAIGTNFGNTMSFGHNSAGTRSAFASAAASTVRYTRSGGDLQVAAYTDEEREQSTGEDDQA